MCDKVTQIAKIVKDPWSHTENVRDLLEIGQTQPVRGIYGFGWKVPIWLPTTSIVPTNQYVTTFSRLADPSAKLEEIGPF